MAWLLCNRPRYLAWNSLALGWAVMAHVWLPPVHDYPVALALLWPSMLGIAAATAVQQATASRLGQPRTLRWVLVALATAAVLATLVLKEGFVSNVLAWACAAVLGQKMWKLWHIPLRHRWERCMLLAHTVGVALLLVYPVVAAVGAQPSLWGACWWASVWAIWTLYSVALVACAWTDNPYRGTGVRMDPLTGLMPYAALKTVCEPLPYARGLRALMLCDLGSQQLAADAPEHALEDELLRRFARILQAQVREGDHIGRLEGNEFAIVLRHIDLSSAHALALRISTQIAQAPWVQKIAKDAVTPRFGIAAIGEEDSFDAALHRADVLLYQAHDAQMQRIWVEAVPEGHSQSK